MSDTFMCPSGDLSKRAYEGEDVQAFSNWPAPYADFSSYSYNCPFPTRMAVSGGWKFDVTLGPDYPFASDINPGDRGGTGPTHVSPGADKKAIRAANSPNHWSDGQNVAYCDGHVEWRDTPFAGVKGYNSLSNDNIFAAGGGSGSGGAIWVQPTAAGDAMMLPTAQDNLGGAAAIASRTPDMTAPMDPLLLWGSIIGGVVVIGVIVLIIWLAKRKKAQVAMAGYGAPPGMYPPGAYPPGAYPPGAYPPGAYPPGAYPPGYPPQQYPPQQYQQPPQQGQWPPRQQ
jgi:prepilin-type processing-associated H-X9-DG protein